MTILSEQIPRYKEEPETVKPLGEYTGKFIATEAAKQARKIIVSLCRGKNDKRRI